MFSFLFEKADMVFYSQPKILLRIGVKPFFVVLQLINRTTSQ